MEETPLLKKLILQKLVRSNTWGGKHTPLAFISNGIPNHYRNTRQGKKMITYVLQELIQEGWILMLLKRTGKNTTEHVSLNPRKVAEIKQFLETFAQE